MDSKTVWFLVAYGILLISAIVWLLWMVGQILNDYVKSRRRKEFLNDLEAALRSGDPTWDQIKLIAETRLVPIPEINKIVKKLIREIITGRKEDLAPKYNLINEYLNTCRREEPFDEIPDDIRLHLQRIREGIGDNYELLEPVANHIKTLLEIRSSERKKDRKIAIISLLIGVVGLIVGVFPLFNSVSGKDKESSKLSGTTFNNVSSVQR